MIKLTDVDASLVYQLRKAGEELGYSPVRAGRTEAQYQADVAALKATLGFCHRYILQTNIEPDLTRTEPATIRVYRRSTRLVQNVLGNFVWEQIKTAGPNLDKWVRKQLSDYVDVAYTLYFTFANRAQQQAMEETIYGAFAHYGYTKLYTNAEVPQRVFYSDVSTERQGIVYVPTISETIGTGMCMLEVKGIQVERIRYWNEEQSRWVLNVASATMYDNLLETQTYTPIIDVGTVS